MIPHGGRGNDLGILEAGRLHMASRFGTKVVLTLVSRILILGVVSLETEAEDKMPGLELHRAYPTLQR